MRSRVVHTAFSLLAGSRFRFAMTVIGIALCILLMAFLVGVYRGVSDGSVEYVRASAADAWVLQEGSTNILRGFSLLTRAHGNLLREIEGVRSVSPVLFRLTTIECSSGAATTYLTGFSPEDESGGPPALVEGRNVRIPGELVLDRAFALRWGCRPGDTVSIMGNDFRVTGISDGSNMFVIQYAFAHIEDLRALYGVNDLVSAYLVRLEPGTDESAFVRTASEEVPGIAAFDGKTFLDQNVAEMETGFLPIVFMMMSISAVLLTAIIGLLLTMNVLEHRNEFAVLKAIGAPRLFLPSVLLAQSLQLVALSGCLALTLGVPTIALVSAVAPEIAVSFTASDIIGLLLVLTALVLCGSVLPLLRVRGIYPAEAFR